MPRSSSDAHWVTRALRTVAKLVHDTGGLIALTAGGSSAQGVGAGEWREAMRPPLQRIWIEHDSRRDDWVQPLASIEAVVTDGLLMSHVAIRLSLKNRIIVASLREHQDFDRAVLEDFARAELLRLAAESDQTATRLDPIVNALPVGDRGSLAQQLERDEQVRRPAVHRALAHGLREASTDQRLLASMVEQAREDAIQEFGQALSSELVRRSPIVDADYEARRAARLRALIRTDLRALQRARTGTNPQRRDRWASTRDRS